MRLFEHKLHIWHFLIFIKLFSQLIDFKNSINQNSESFLYFFFAIMKKKLKAFEKENRNSKCKISIKIHIEYDSDRANIWGSSRKKSDINHRNEMLKFM